MTAFVNKGFLIGSLALLAACSSGGGGGGAEQSPLFFGSTDPAVARSGLDYADGTQDKTDLDGQQHTVRVTRTVTDTVTGEVEVITTDEVVTLGAPNSDDFVANFTITLDGETLTFVGSRAEREDGTTILGSEVVTAANEFVGRFILLSAEEFGGRADKSTTAFFVTGFETNPDAITAIGGTATYAGDIGGFTNGALGTVSAAASGTFSLTAGFGDGMVEGTFNLTDFDTQFGDGTVDLALAPTAITGNGFAGDLTLTDCSFDACTSGSSLGGAFFGPNAEEVGGIISIDIGVTDGGETQQINGDGAFIGVESP